MTTPPAPQPILTFSLDEQRYALFIENVVEVASMVAMITVNDERPMVVGAINRHGNVLPMFDLRLIMGQNMHPIDANSVFIVAQHQGRQAGLVVTEVHQVMHIQTDQIRKSNQVGTYIRGMIGLEHDVLQIIDIVSLWANFLT